MHSNFLKRLESIEKKRWELLSLEIIVLTFMAITVIVLSILEEKSINLLFLGILMGLFCIYVVSKERELKRLNISLTHEQFKNIEERIRTSSAKERLKEVVMLYKVGRICISRLSLQKKLDKMLYIAQKLVQADRASIMLSNENTGTFIIASAIGIDPNLLRSTTQRIEEGVAGWVCKHKTPLILSGKIRHNQFKNFIKKNTDLHSSISMPLKIKGKVIGVLNLSYLKGTNKTFTEHDVRLMSFFAKYISTAIEHAQLSLKKTGLS